MEHLTLAERHKTTVFLDLETSKKIAAQLSLNRSTIYRELKPATNRQSKWEL